MPEISTYNPEDAKDAQLMTQLHGFKLLKVDITPIIKAFSVAVPVFDPANQKAVGNLKARTRMMVLYYLANKLQAVVAGTGNKTRTP